METGWEDDRRSSGQVVSEQETGNFSIGKHNTKLSEALGRQPGLSSFCGHLLEQFYLNKSIFKR